MGDFVLEFENHNFKGPIELLYELIDKRKLLIHDISLAKVADDFIAYIEKQENFPVGEAASFLAVASTLLLIKSRSLLPGLVLTSDEQEDAKNLERRLALFARMKELSKNVKERWAVNPEFQLLPKRNFEIVFAPSKNLTVTLLGEAFERVISLIPKLEKKDKMSVAKVISLEQMITSLGERLTKAMSLSFNELAKEHGGTHKNSKLHIPKELRKNLIVSFLALLELVKRGVIEAMQENPSGDILVESKTLSTPNYG
ncbi:MAG: ScpA family protein [Minisyncoccia bacterium]